MSSYMYILKCSDGSFYTGSTRELEKRVMEHNMGLGEIQGWSHSKKEALIQGQFGKLTDLSKSSANKRESA